MSSASAAPSFRIVDPHVHVWINDPAYPWAKETTEPPRQDATPDMLLDLMTSNGVARTVLVKDFRHIDPKTAKVLILEGSPKILGMYPKDLQQSAVEQQVHGADDIEQPDRRGRQLAVQQCQCQHSYRFCQAAYRTAIAYYRQGF